MTLFPGKILDMKLLGQRMHKIFFLNGIFEVYFFLVTWFTKEITKCFSCMQMTLHKFIIDFTHYHCFRKFT